MMVLTTYLLFLLVLWCPPPLFLPASAMAPAAPTQPLTREMQMQAVKVAANLVAGVYKKDEAKSMIPSSLNQTIVMTACNSGYLPHLLNFDCYATRLGIKYMVFALDVNLHAVLQRKYPHIVSVSYSSKKITGIASNFRSKHFNLITNRKEEAVLCALILGYDAVFIDVDIAMVKDPIPKLIIPRYDYVHSVNVRCSKDLGAFNYGNRQHEGNTGLYFVRSNAKSISVWKQALKASIKQPGLDDQTLFWNTIRDMKTPQLFFTTQCQQEHVSSSELKKVIIAWKGHDSPMQEMWLTCPLDACSFSTGALHGRYGYSELMRTLMITNRSIYSVHANFVTGAHKKRMALERHGFWIFNDNSMNVANTQQCKQFALHMPPDPPKGETIIKAVAK